MQNIKSILNVIEMQKAKKNVIPNDIPGKGVLKIFYCKAKKMS